MQILDWTIVAGLLALLTVGAASTRRHARTVDGFLAAERCAGRYLIAVSDNIARLGVVTLVWYFELHYEVGFTAIWWTLLEEPVMIVMALSGWVIYRFRQTRALTLAEFLERRYSRRFRIFTGIVAFIAGVINFGIFPSVGARFFIQLWSLPAQFDVMGVTFSTFETLMSVLLIVPLALLLLGGQIAVIVTDFLQGVIANIAFVAINLFLLLSFSWGQIGDTLMAAPEGNSMVDPFDLEKQSDFNIFYYVITVITLFYAARGWQGTQGYNCSAINAHEAKMSFILGQWRFRVLMLITIVLPICMKTFLTHPDYAEGAMAANERLATIDGEALQNQLRAPIVMNAILPAGLLGLASAAMLGAFISTHDTYLHSWAAILVQDVILPFRKRRLSEREHLLLLRIAVFLIAIFVFLFSYYFQHVQYIAMYCASSAAIFVGGVGAAIIGGLYWNRGTTAAAWAAMITGMLVAGVGTVINQMSEQYVAALQALELVIESCKADPPASISRITQVMFSMGHVAVEAILFVRMELNGQLINFWAICSSSLMYIVVSLCQGGEKFNLDKLLHRGDYAMEGESSLSIRDARGFWEKLGFSREFTGTDRLVTNITLGWPLFWTVAFIAVTIIALTYGITADAWLSYWHVWTWLILCVGGAVTIWLTIGGFRDLIRMYRMLGSRTDSATNKLENQGLR